MKLLKNHIHHSIDNQAKSTSFTRLASRAICVKGKQALLLYTGRYDDYSLPGGGVDEDEDVIEALKRELKEETGAQNIRDIKAFGIYEEKRPWYKEDFDIMHMISHCYTCTIDYKLGSTKYEDYEIKNQMKPLWIDIHEAIEHNKKVIESSEKKGMSIERETFLLELILKELVSIS